ncbi:MAG: hypothetical protein ACPL1K_00450 [Candidatus Kryptoniota bacterium]
MKDNELNKPVAPTGRRKIIKTLGIGVIGLMIFRFISNPILKLRNHSSRDKRIKISVNKLAVKRGKKVVKNV